METICFYNAKERVGKSLLTLAVADYIHRDYEMETCILDFSKSPKSLFHRTKDQIERFGLFGGETLQNIFRMETVDENLKEKYDLCFIDMDSTTPNETCIELITGSDYLFIVSDAESKEDFRLEKNILFSSLKDFVYNPETQLKDVFFIFNRTADNSLPDKLGINSATIEKLKILPYVVKEDPKISDFLNTMNEYITDISSLSGIIYSIIKKESLVEVYSQTL